MTEEQKQLDEKIMQMALDALNHCREAGVPMEDLLTLAALMGVSNEFKKTLT
jgi:hypothetical protein